GSVFSAAVRGDDKTPRPVVGCAAAVDNSFEDEVWAKVVVHKCLTCHRKGGDAQDSKFVLIDSRKRVGADRDEAMRHNRAALARLAAVKEKDKSRMLLKVVGELDHGGSDVLKADSAGYRILADFVGRVNGLGTGKAPAVAVDPKAPPFFQGVTMLDDRQLLRRATLSLAGRLPTGVGVAALARDGRKTEPAILDAVMKEDAFYDRLREGFNDVFLTLGVDGNADQTCLSYEHFEKTRHWYQKFDLSHIKDQNERQRTEWRIAAEYRKA